MIILVLVLTVAIGMTPLKGILFGSTADDTKITANVVQNMQAAPPEPIADPEPAAIVEEPAPVVETAPEVKTPAPEEKKEPEVVLSGKVAVQVTGVSSAKYATGTGGKFSSVSLLIDNGKEDFTPSIDILIYDDTSSDIHKSSKPRNEAPAVLPLLKAGKKATTTVPVLAMFTDASTSKTIVIIVSDAVSKEQIVKYTNTIKIE
jgi:hypothetical protein